MENKKSITLNGITGIHLAYMALSVAIVGICLYLTNHYFEVQFPTGLGQTTFCDFNSFWNCDAATFSSISNIAGIPISIFGLIIGIFLIIGSIFPSSSIEGLNKLISYVNALGCFVLFIYSIAVLGSLCPFCTLYYICSWILAFLFFKYSSSIHFCPRVALAFLGFSAFVVGSMKYSVIGSEKKQNEIAADLIKQYEKLPTMGEPKISSLHWLAKASENFTDAPLRLSLFSDFQCPACKKLSEIVPKITKRYQGKINIQYFFYPLDKACNVKMTQNVHVYACQAAYLAACSGDKFEQVHDDIFEHQHQISGEWLRNKAKALGVEECVDSKETQERVMSYISQADTFSVGSTPTLLLNGKRIDGLLPLKQMYVLLDHLLSK